MANAENNEINFHSDFSFLPFNIREVVENEKLCKIRNKATAMIIAK